MRLQVKHHLQTMLKFSQPFVILRQDSRFSVGQTLDFGQPPNRIQCVGCSNLRKLATIKQLHELDHKFDVSNSSMPCLDIGFTFTCLRRSTFDFSLQRFDATDISTAEISPVYPRS